LAAAAGVRAGDTGADPAAKTAWGENVGWVNAAPADRGLAVHFDGGTGWLSGYAWGENVGWIKFGADAGGPYANSTATDWGVNMNGSGAISGYAWGENIGWVKFGTAYGGVTVNLASGTFAGRAWGENVGWLTFSGTAPDYGVRTLAFDMQPLGTPNWWLDHYGVSEATDEGDGVPAADEYVADTNPNDPTSYLRIVAVTNAPATASVVFAPSSSRRYYTLVRRPGLNTGTWGDVSGQTGIPGVGGEHVLQDTEAAPQMFYRVRVSVSP
jgi:hypothetical protein